MFNIGHDYNKVDINKYNKQFRKFKDMYYIIENEFYPELVNEIDIAKSIVICTPNNYNFIRRNKFGKLDILASVEINLSNCYSINEYIKRFNCVPKIKLLVPKDIEVYIDKPDNNFTNMIYPSITVEERKHHKSDIIDYLVYKRIELDIYIDINQLKRRNSLYIIKYDQPIFNISFKPICFVGSINPVSSINNEIYWIKNDELFKTFEDTF